MKQLLLFFFFSFFAFNAFGQTTSKTPPRTYDEVWRDFDKQAKQGTDTLYQMMTKAAGIARIAMESIDLSTLDKGTVVIEGDTINVSQPFERIYERVRKVYEKMEEPQK